MIQNQRTLIFLFIVSLIMINLFHKQLNISMYNKKLLLLAIILAIFIFYNKFVTPRVEKFIETATTETPTTETATTETPTTETPTAETPTTETPIEMPNLKNLYLNKSIFHKKSRNTGINQLLSSSSVSSNLNDDTTQKNIGKNLLNFHNTNFENTTDSTIQSDIPINNFFKFNYLNTNDMLKSITTRNYDFPIVNLNFNQDEKSVSTNNEESPNEISNIIYNGDNVVTDDTATDDTATDDTTTDDTTTDDTPTSIKVGAISQSSTQRDGIDGFINMFFTSIKNIFS